MSDGPSHWIQVDFKGKQVFAACGPDGEYAPAEDGRVPFLYSLGGRKTYSTYPDRLKPSAGAKPVKADGPVPAAAKKRPSRAVKAENAKLVEAPGTAVVGPPDAIHLWGDGACTGNPGPCGAGSVLLDGGKRTEWSTWLGQGTNNIGELTAILQGLQSIERPITRAVVVHTDSKYSIGVLAKGWKAKANQELIAEIKAQLEDFPEVQWHWVRGHDGVPLNERCDALARQAIVARSSVVQDYGK